MGFVKSSQFAWLDNVERVGDEGVSKNCFMRERREGDVEDQGGDGCKIWKRIQGQ